MKRQDRRFPFYVHCKACGHVSEFVKLADVAVKLWNDAKRGSR